MEGTNQTAATAMQATSYPDIDAMSLDELRHLISTGIQARPGLHAESIQELDRRMSYAHGRAEDIRKQRDDDRKKELSKPRRLTQAEAGHIAHMIAHGPTDPRPLSQPLMDMGLVQFYEDTDAIEHTPAGNEALYGGDRLKWIPAEWMTPEERKRAGL